MITTSTNIEVGAVNAKPTTQLSFHDFNSYAEFNGSYLACGADGIYVFGEDDDFDGTPIDAMLKSRTTTFGYEGVKRLRFIYLSILTEGDLTITITVDDVVRDPISVTKNKTGRQYIRVPVGRSAKGLYFNFLVENVDGAYFSIDVMEGLINPRAKGHNNY